MCQLNDSCSKEFHRNKDAGQERHTKGHYIADHTETFLVSGNLTCKKGKCHGYKHVADHIEQIPKSCCRKHFFSEYKASSNCKYCASKKSRHDCSEKDLFCHIGIFICRACDPFS